jgi:DNA primase
MAIPQTFIQELVARIDIVDVVGRYVQLKKGGVNLMGLCPFHAEKSPSFSVSPTKQFYHCFGCGKNGNAISFLMDHVGMDFIEAVQDLAQQCGMQVPQDEEAPEERERAKAQREKQQTLTSVLEKACEAYRKHLKDNQRAVEYFKGRGLSGDVAKQFGLGYAPEGWRSLASVFPHYDDPLLVESGLVISNNETPGTEEKRYDRFRDRVMFPIRNIKGECIGFGGRVLGDDKPKYLNSPETPVFSKGRELYGLFEARHALRDAGYVLVTEGYMDVVALAQLGFPNAVATLGTACTQEHVQKLFRFTDAVVFSFDGDSAGRRAARKALDGALAFATDTRSIKFLFLPTEHDPDSFIRAHGPEAFAKYVAQATPLSRFLIESGQEDCDLLTTEGRAHFSSNVKPLWMQLPEGAFKLQLLGEIADLVQLDSRELTALWIPTAKKPTSFKSNKARAPFNGYDQAPSHSPSWTNDYPSSKKTGGGLSSRGRKAPSTRADHAARLLLSNAVLWETLSNEEHALLCALPPAHGTLFMAFEGLLHEHGPLTWSALREEMEKSGCAADIQTLAQRVMQDAPTAEDDPQGIHHELRDLLHRMLLEQLTAESKALALSAATNPQDYLRYKEILERQKTLRAKTEGIIEG